MPNDDTIFHNVFSLSKTRPFDLDIYKPGDSKSVTFNTPGLVKVYCNIHPKMMANIIVLANPYFAVTNRMGFFVIPNVPEGEYRLRTWYEFGPETKQSLRLKGHRLHRRNIKIEVSKKFVQHPNKFGKHYKKKY